MEKLKIIYLNKNGDYDDKSENYLAICYNRYANYDYQKQFTGDLDKLIAELENVKVKAEDVMKMSGTRYNPENGDEIKVPFSEWENGLWDADFWGLVGYKEGDPNTPVGWGDGDAYVECLSFADITILNTGPYNEPYETDFYYSTPEVIQVLKQWRDYEEKTVKEELEKEKTKPKKTFVDKLLGK